MIFRYIIFRHRVGVVESMFKSYFTIAWRTIRKDHPFTLLNLIGLSTGLACTLLIYLWVTDELAMDHFHDKDSRLYQVMDSRHSKDGIHVMEATPALLARTLKEEMPEVEYAAAVLPVSWYGRVTLSATPTNGAAGSMANSPGSLTDSARPMTDITGGMTDSVRPMTDTAGKMTFSSKQEDIKAVGHFADEDFFNVFSYPLLQGNRDRVLADKKSIVLSRELALKLFHTTENVIGKTVEWEHAQPYVVSGIFESDQPHSSDRFDFVLPMETFLDTHPWEKVWGRSEEPNTYVVLKQGANVGAFNRKIEGLIKRKSQDADINLTLSTRLYSSGYLYGRYENGVQAGGRIEYVRLFSLIALFILVIACVNFMNLSTAKASERMKEVGVKKSIGASRLLLILQFLGEFLVMTCISLVLAVLLVKGLLPEFNSITGKQLSLLPDNQFVGVLLAVALVTGLLAGSYPALYLSSFRPAIVLKGTLRTSVGEVWARKGLVVFQFTLTVLFIVAVLGVYKQIQYKTSIGVGVFLSAGSATLLITIATISFQTAIAKRGRQADHEMFCGKAEAANPAGSLIAE